MVINTHRIKKSIYQKKKKEKEIYLPMGEELSSERISMALLSNEKAEFISFVG